MLKNGVWVTVNGYRYTGPYQVERIETAEEFGHDEDFVCFKDDYCVELYRCIPWQPKEDEWCWHRKMGLVKCIGEDKYEHFYTKEVVFDAIDWVEPFIGELPTFIKGK